MPAALPPPEILLEQGAVLLVNKPGGLLTQAPPGIDSLELRIKQFLIQRENKPGKAYLGVPHRLDRPVSGVMVVAKNVRAAKRISEQIQQREVEKIYWAILEGELPTPAAAADETWVDWMRKVPGEARSEIVDSDHAEAKQAVLRCQILARSQWGPPRTIVAIRLQTGRTHQIRLQAAHRGYPIIGDSLYGAQLPFGPETLDLRKRWIGLHARTLGLVHPMDKSAIRQHCPLPKWWLETDLAKTLDSLVQADL